MSDITITAIIAVIGVIGVISGVFISHFLSRDKTPKAILSVIICIILIVIIIFVLNLKNGSNTNDDDSSGSDPPGSRIEDPISDDDPTPPVGPDNSNPIYKSLRDLEPYEYSPPSLIGSYPFEREKDIEDIFSISYNYALRAYSDRSNGEHYETYYLNKKYNSFEFYLAIPKGYKGNNRYTGSISIYTDDKLITEVSDIKTNFKTEKFTIDVSDVNDLKIEMYAGSSSYSMESMSIMICNPTLIIYD